VATEEYLFECRHGRVTFANVPALLNEVRKALPEKVEQLRTRWDVTDVAGPVGEFRLRYTLERVRSSPLDMVLGNQPPVDEDRFQYGLKRWELEPVSPVRGETLREALCDGSRFRGLVDRADPQETALTFFVYPDSFELYRGLRDYLHDRGFIVAGRPLPDGQPIVGSARHGSISRGQ
jgi:hypothetical protein